MPWSENRLQSALRLSYRQKLHDFLGRKGWIQPPKKKKKRKAQRSPCFEVFFLLLLCHLCRQSKANIRFLCSYLFSPLTLPRLNFPFAKYGLKNNQITHFCVVAQLTVQSCSFFPNSSTTICRFENRMSSKWAKTIQVLSVPWVTASCHHRCSRAVACSLSYYSLQVSGMTFARLAPPLIF